MSEEVIEEIHSMRNGEIVTLDGDDLAELELSREALRDYHAIPVPYRLYKSVFIRRLTSDEAETMEGVLAQADAKLRLMFNSVEYFVSDDPLFATLLAAVGAALGEQRAQELLTPS